MIVNYKVNLMFTSVVLHRCVELGCHLVHVGLW